jgi:hypothetical protein
MSRTGFVAFLLAGGVVAGSAQSARTLSAGPAASNDTQRCSL